MLVWAIWQSNARAARSANSTAFLLITGSVPGIPQQTGQTAVFGSAVVLSTTAHEQNIFECVASSTCTSNPMSTIYFAKRRIL